MVLLDLVNDLTPDAIVILQFQFDTLNDGPVALDESIATISQPDAKELMPNFTIVIFDPIRCHCDGPVLHPTQGTPRNSTGSKTSDSLKCSMAFCFLALQASLTAALAFLASSAALSTLLLLLLSAQVLLFGLCLLQLHQSLHLQVQL